MNRTGGTASKRRITAIYEEIRHRICTNHYPPGTVLREEVLAGEYSVSRTPIRRVLAMLQHEELVDIQHGIGTIVTSIDPDQLREIYSLRMILAEASGAFIPTPFPSGTADFFDRIRGEFLALPEGDVRGFGETNIRYYREFTGLVTNASLRDLQLNLFYKTSRMWLLLLPSLPWRNTLAAIGDELAEITRLIAVEDPHGLGLIARNHIYFSSRHMFEVLERG